MGVRCRGAGPAGSRWRPMVAAACLASCATVIPEVALAVIPGDVNANNRVDAADALLLQRHLSGDTTLSQDQLDRVDIAPLTAGVSTPDGQVNVADLLILLRLLSGQLGPDAPVLDAIGDPPNSNPIAVTGTGTDGVTVHLFVNGVEWERKTISGGTFQFDDVIVLDNDPNGPNNPIFAVGVANGLASTPSNQLTWDFVNDVLRTYSGTSLTGGAGTVVWTPRNVSGVLEPFQLSGTVTIDAGDRLMIAQGTELRFAPGAKLQVRGQLIVRGAPGDLVLFTGSGSAWLGIDSGPSGIEGLEIAYTRIEDAEIGVQLRRSSPAGTSVIFRNNEIVMSLPSSYGLFIEDSGLAVRILDNDLLCTGTSPTAIHLRGAQSGRLQGNSITGTCRLGMFLRGDFRVYNNTIIRTGGPATTTGIELDSFPVYGTRPIIHGNWISGFSQGIAIGLEVSAATASWPSPSIRYNTIQDNTSNIGIVPYTESQALKHVINAQYNYWGVTEPGEAPGAIGDRISDRMDTPEAPLIDYTPFLEAEAPDGPVNRVYVQGHVAPLDFDTSPGAPAHVAVGPIVFPTNPWRDEEDSGSGLIPGDVTIQMDPAFAIEAYATLRILAAAGEEATFCAAPCDGTPQPGGWPGIQIESGASKSIITGAVIRDAVVAIDTEADGTEIYESEIHDFSDVGVRFNDTQIVDETEPRVQDSLISNVSAAPGVRGIGIEIIEGTAWITGNTIEGAEAGVRIIGDATPKIGEYIDGGAGDLPGNLIQDNAWGIWVDMTAGGSAQPTINLNTFANNDVVIADQAGPANLRTTGGPETESQVDARRNDWGSTDPATILSTIRQELLPIVVDYSLFLDGAGMVVGGAGLVTAVVIGVTSSPPQIEPTLNPGQQATIQFETLISGDVKVHIYNEQDDLATATPVKTIYDVAGTSPGPKVASWDGTDSAGYHVPPEAYLYAIEVDDGSQSFLFDGRALERPFQDDQMPPEGVGGNPNAELFFDPYRNEFLKVEFETLSAASRIRIRWLYPVDLGGGPEYASFDFPDPSLPGIAYKHSDNTNPIADESIVFDGRTSDGALFIEDPDLVSPSPAEFPGKISFLVPDRMKPNIVIVKSTAPVVPDLQLKADPYLIQHTYDQVTRIDYCLDQPADVTIKILRPGETQPDGPGVVATLEDDTPKSATPCDSPHTVDWYPETSEIDGEGYFTFTIEATPQGAPTPKSLARGVISVRR